MGRAEYWDPTTQSRKPIKSGSIVDDTGLEYAPSDVKAIDDKCGILNGVGATKEKANKSDVDPHLADNTKHITSSERTKWNKTDTDLGTHKADIATQADANKIPRALVTGKLDPSWISIDGIWENVAIVELSANVAEFNVEGLSEYKHIKIIFSASSDSTGANSNLLMNFNDDTDARYSVNRYLTLVGNNNTANSVILGEALPRSPWDCNGEINISNIGGKFKSYYANFKSGFSADTSGALVYGIWTKKTPVTNAYPQIEKIKVKASTGAIKQGAYFVVMGVK